MTIAEHPENVPVFEYAMAKQFGIPRTIAFLNARYGELEKTRRHLLVRCEDMRTGPGNTLRQILEIMKIQPADNEISHVIERTSFSKMKKMEGKPGLDPGSRRLMVKAPDNPDTCRVRRGKVGGYRDYFSDDQLDLIDTLARERLDPFHGYR